jgi:hypothetical protein
MKKLVFTACTLTMIIFAGPALALSCVSQTLADYVGLGSAGCSVGGFQFSSFSIVTPGATQIPGASITVTPVVGPSGPGFSLSSGGAITAGSGEALELYFGANVRSNTGAYFTSNTLDLGGSATASGDASITIVEDKCLDGTFSTPSFGCSGAPLTSIVFATEAISDLSETATFAPASFFDVFVDLVIDGGPTGNASLGPALGGIGTAVVPEPPVLVLAALALVLLACYRPVKNRGL